MFINEWFSKIVPLNRLGLATKPRVKCRSNFTRSLLLRTVEIMITLRSWKKKGFAWVNIYGEKRCVQQEETEQTCPWNSSTEPILMSFPTSMSAFLSFKHCAWYGAIIPISLSATEGKEESIQNVRGRNVVQSAKFTNYKIPISLQFLDIIFDLEYLFDIEERRRRRLAIVFPVNGMEYHGEFFWR